MAAFGSCMLMFEPRDPPAHRPRRMALQRAGEQRPGASVRPCV
jgi:hypothetical protein